MSTSLGNALHWANPRAASGTFLVAETRLVTDGLWTPWTAGPGGVSSHRSADVGTGGGCLVAFYMGLKSSQGFMKHHPALRGPVPLPRRTAVVVTLVCQSRVSLGARTGAIAVIKH